MIFAIFRIIRSAEQTSFDSPGVSNFPLVAVCNRAYREAFLRMHYFPRQVASLLHLTLCFAVWCGTAGAQVNIFTGETMKQMQLEPGWYNSISLDSRYLAGNTELLTLRTRCRTDYLAKTYHGFVLGSLQLGRKSGTFFTNKGMAHGRIIRKVTRHVALEVFVQKQFNTLILLRDRNLAGGGARFAVMPSNPWLNLYLGIGAMWEHERLNDAKAGELNTRIVRATNYINWSGQLNERVTTSATGYYQVHVNSVADYRLLFEGNITFRLTTRLAFPLRLNLRYDGAPPAGVERYDVEIFNGLRYTF